MQSVNNFSFYQFNKVDLKKQDVKEETILEEKGEETVDPKGTPEIVVITADSAEIEAAIAKALVPGAGPVMSPTGGGDGDEWEQILSEYYALESEYEQNKENMNYDERMDAIAEMQGKLESILGGDFPGIPEDIWEQLNSEYIDVTQEKYDTQMSYWNGEILGNDGCCDHTYEKWLDMYSELTQTINDMTRYCEYNSAWVDEKMIEVNQEWLSEIESLNGEADHETILSELNSLMSTIEHTMEDHNSQGLLSVYLDAESMNANVINNSMSSLNTGNSTTDNVVQLLNILLYHNPNYDVVFNNQGDIENYRYFQAQIAQNQVYLNALYHYRDLFSNKGNSEMNPDNPLQEINIEIERIEALLASARNYLRQIPIGINNANIPAEY